MLLPSKLATMKLGIKPGWQPWRVTPRVSAQLASVPPAYSRIVGAPRVEGDNTNIGDCFPTACCNAVQTLLARMPSPTGVPCADAIAAYEGMAGYKPGDSTTDQGTDPNVGFTWWHSNAIAGYKLAGLTPINPKAENEIRESIGAVGGVLLCVALSIANQNQRVWEPDGTPGSWGGHAIWCDDYDGAIYSVTSWGEAFFIERAFFEQPGFVQGVYRLDLESADMPVPQ